MSDLQTQSADSRVVVFVDSRVEDAGQLTEQLPAGAEVVWLDPAQDGLAQMAAALGSQGDVAAVHVLAHGHEGQLWLGNTFVDNQSLAAQGEALAAIGQGLTGDGDLLLYACNTAGGEAGAQFVASLAELTGADVAASDDRTGGGGDWSLEITTGEVQARPVLDGEALASYGHDLATLTVTTNADSGAGSLRATIAAAIAGDTITFNAGMTVALSTLASGDSLLLINKNLTIDGDLDNNGTADVTLDGQYNGRVLQVSSGTVVLDGLVITHGLLAGDGVGRGDASDVLGAGISNAGTLTLRNTSVAANAAAGGGGGAGIVNAHGGGGGGGGGGIGGGWAAPAVRSTRARGPTRVWPARPIRGGVAAAITAPRSQGRAAARPAVLAAREAPATRTAARAQRRPTARSALAVAVAGRATTPPEAPAGQRPAASTTPRPVRFTSSVRRSSATTWGPAAVAVVVPPFLQARLAGPAASAWGRSGIAVRST